MQTDEQFRIYYNHTIHPELMRMEGKRRRLLAYMLISIFLVIGIAIFEYQFRVFVVTIILITFLLIYISWLIYQARKFRSTFKPNVVNLILDYIDNGPNLGTLTYKPKGFIPKKKFLASQLFETPAPQYQGEDYISGTVGDVQFELCELNVREFSKVRNRLQYVFRGVFMHARSNTDFYSEIMVWPSKFKPYLSRSIKAFTGQGGRSVSTSLLVPGFAKAFMTFTHYSEPEGGGERAIRILLPELQTDMVEFREATGKEMYLSFVGKDIYIGVQEHKDLLEPHLWEANTSYELINEFYQDIKLLINMVQLIDKYH